MLLSEKKTNKQTVESAWEENDSISFVAQKDIKK